MVHNAFRDYIAEEPVMAPWYLVPGGKRAPSPRRSWYGLSLPPAPSETTFQRAEGRRVESVLGMFPKAPAKKGARPKKKKKMKKMKSETPEPLSRLASAMLVSGQSSIDALEEEDDAPSERSGTDSSAQQAYGQEHLIN